MKEIIETYKCDRCGATIKTLVTNNIKISDRYEKITLDLCTKCQTELETWLKNPKIKIPTDFNK